MAAIDLKNVTVKIRDGTATPRYLEIKFGSGTLSWTEKKNMEYVLDRGLLDIVREGDQVPVDVKFEGTYETLRTEDDASTDYTLREFLTKTGNCDDNESTDTDACQPYAVDIVALHDLPCSDVKNEKVVLALFRAEQIDFDVKAATISVTGKCNITAATVTRQTGSTY